jgi:hypothetical protein
MSENDLECIASTGVKVLFYILEVQGQPATVNDQVATNVWILYLLRRLRIAFSFSQGCYERRRLRAKRGILRR